MPKMIFVNLPVRDVAASTAFYEALGMERNPRFSNEQTSCMVWSDSIYFMLMAHDFYRTFIDKPIADTKASSAVLICLSQESREAVDAFLQAALDAGAHEPRPPQDHGFMYGRSFEDMDGHEVETMWMDPQAAEQGPPDADASADAGARQTEDAQ